MADNQSIQQQLDELKSQNQEILTLLHRLCNPASSLSTQEKADAIVNGYRSGGRKKMNQVLKQINGG